MCDIVGSGEGEVRFGAGAKQKTSERWQGEQMPADLAHRKENQWSYEIPSSAPESAASVLNAR